MYHRLYIPLQVVAPENCYAAGKRLEYYIIYECIKSHDTEYGLGCEYVRMLSAYIGSSVCWKEKKVEAR